MGRDDYPSGQHALLKNLHNGVNVYVSQLVAPVPLPGALPLFGSVLGLLGIARWRRKFAMLYGRVLGRASLAAVDDARQADPRAAVVSIMPMLLRVGAACSVVALIALSWLPGEDMIRTSLLSVYAEHALAYWISGLLVALALPRKVPHVAAFYVFLACVLELGQAFIPGRNPEVISGFVSVCGALAGMACAALLGGSAHRKATFESAF